MEQEQSTQNPAAQESAVVKPARTGTLSQRREYLKLAKRKSRAKQKQETVDAYEYLTEFWDSKDYLRIKQFISEQSEQIRSELNQAGITASSESDECVTQVLSLYFGFTNGIIKRVTKPNGVVVGWLYPDAVGDNLVAWTRKYDLERSSSYSKFYRSLLETLDRRFGFNSESSDSVVKHCAETIRQRDNSPVNLWLSSSCFDSEVRG